MKRLFVILLISMTLVGVLVGPATAGKCWIKKGYPISVSEDNLDKFLNLVRSGDKVAAQKMLDKKQVFVTLKAIEAYIYELHVFGHHEVRLPGYDTVWWVPKKAVVFKKPE